MKRRDFMTSSASVAILVMIDAHAMFESQPLERKLSEKNHRIKSLRLLTTTSLTEMKNFYGTVLGLPVTVKNQSIGVQAGRSSITFTNTNSDERPFYHFAFNIPENKIEKALSWQRPKTAIVHPNPEGPRDAVVHFRHWNAHSVFFLDPAGNLLEYIARHDLQNSASGEFSSKDILYVSEIGFIVDDVDRIGSSIQKSLSMGSYRPGENFIPIGDEYGLLLMIKKGRIWSSHPNQVNKVDVFKTSVSINNAIKATWKASDYPYEILVD
jgi:catechol-2,3-dioxygenase